MASEGESAKLAAARAAFIEAAAAYQLATLDLLAAMAEPARPAAAPVEPEGTLLLTVKEATAELRLGERTVYEMLRTGELPSVHAGTRVLVRRADLIAWAAAHLDGEAPAA